MFTVCFQFVLLVQPLKSNNMVDSGIPAWAVAFIERIELKNIMDLVEAATVLRIKMSVFEILTFFFYIFWG